VKLPNAERALVERGKLVDYLLDLEHADGGPKARFFMAFGFSRPSGRNCARPCYAMRESAR